MTGKLEYVIIRPGGLKSEPATGNAVLTGCCLGCVYVRVRGWERGHWLWDQKM